MGLEIDTVYNFSSLRRRLVVPRFFTMISNKINDFYLIGITSSFYKYIFSGDVKKAKIIILHLSQSTSEFLANMSHEIH